MDFFAGMFFGALAMAIAVAISITAEPAGKITEYRLMLDLPIEDENYE